jgi:hypothetical protein
MENRKLRWFLDSTLGLYSLVPFCLLVALYSFVVRARFELGRWPSPMQPDPKNLTFPTADTHMDTIVFLGVASLCCFLPWLLTICIRKQLIPTTRRFWIGLLTLPWLLFLIVWFLDPGKYVEWFLD